MPANDETTRTLQAIEKHLETLVRFNYSQIKKQALAMADDGERKAFELTGVKKRDEICDELRMSSATLADLWKKWFDLGLLVKDGKGYKKTVE